jgi:hypothetical protein
LGDDFSGAVSPSGFLGEGFTIFELFEYGFEIGEGALFNEEVAVIITIFDISTTAGVIQGFVGAGGGSAGGGGVGVGDFSGHGFVVVTDGVHG